MWWLIGGIWWIGMLWSTPIRLRARMLGGVCPVSKRRPKEGGTYCKNHDTTIVPRGSVRDRNGADVAIAFARALYWPGQLTGWLCKHGAQYTGRGITRLVHWVTPLTEPERKRHAEELERRLTQQQRDIEQLTTKL